MISDMKEKTKKDKELTVEERDLLSVAYNNVIRLRCASWRVMSSIEQKCKLNSSDKIGITKDYNVKIEEELSEIYNDMLNIMETELITCSSNAKALVFLLQDEGRLPPILLIVLLEGRAVLTSP
jgi:14-3-3 protein epsilon